MSRSGFVLASLLLVSILLAGCATSGTHTGRSELPLDTHWVRNSAEYEALVRQIYIQAGVRLEELAQGHERGSWAVALDADETVISNSQYQKELAAAGATYTRETWNSWARRHEATALPGARDFLDRIHHLGGRIAIVTNRRQEICADTEANFRALELPFDVMLCRRDTGEKEPRWEQIRSGQAAPGFGPLEIVMWLGDNIRDFPDWEQGQRSAARTDWSDFGTKYFVMPNPMYGSWVDNPRR